MRRFLTLVCLLCLAVPAGISISGCTRNPAGNYCNGLGYGLKDTDVASITLQPQTTGISLAFGQTQQLSTPSAKTCKGTQASVPTYTYGTTNTQVVDVSPSGNICAGTWNRNTGGGIANYTICSYPNPLPSSGGLPYTIAYVTASGSSVVSNPVQVYVHAQVTSITLVTEPVTGSAQQCYSQGQTAQLDAQACFVGSNNQQQLFCAPSSVTAASSPSLACPPPPGVSLSSIPDCLAPLGTLSYISGNGSVASINNETNQITAEQPGTTEISASVAGGSSSAGYFSTCPPRSISATLANGATSGTIAQGVPQDLTTTVIDTLGNTITGLSLDYESTDPIDISAGTSGAIAPSFPGVASIYAICQPPSCNPAPINEIGLYGTGLSLSSNPVTVTTPGTASEYVWFAAPGQSQYFTPIELLTGTVGSNVRLPYVPNSMVMDKLGINLYFGSPHALMIYNTANNSFVKADTSAPGVVLAISPNNDTLLINDPVRQLFYLYTVSASNTTTFGGVGNAAAWTPDSKTLYISDSAALNKTPGNVAAGITGHSDTLYVDSENSGWTSYSLPCSVAGPNCPSPSLGAQSLALTIPGVGAYLSGNPTVAHTWCPSGTVGNSASVIFYPQGDSVNAQTDVLAATTDGKHILGASLTGGGVTLSDIGVQIPDTECAVTTTGMPGNQVETLSPLTIQHTLNQVQLTKISATAVNQIVTGSLPQGPASQTQPSSLAFITYTPPITGATAGVPLPYYVPGPGGAAGTVGYVPLGGSSAAAITAPLAGAFSPDNSLFFVSTAGDNLIHYISIPSVISTSTPLKDTQQINPNLPACTPVAAGGNDIGCTFSGAGTVVPATVIAVKPRSTT